MGRRRRAGRITPLLLAALVAACSTAPGVRTQEANAPGSPAGTDPADTNASGDGPAGDQGDGDDGGEPDSTEAPSGAPVSTLDWRACEDRSNPLLSLECATLEVPLDHDDPDGERIEIAVARVDSAGDDRQIGSVVFNPGGPGGSGIEFLTAASLIIPEAVSTRFDLVSFDPRGVGASTALDCEVDFDDEIALVADDDEAAWQALVAAGAEELDRCTDATLALAPWVGTNNAARDLDLLRDALGDERLTYVGYSYGTRLGATYAELFPDRVRALVLDAGVKPVDRLAELGVEQARGFDTAFENFAAACDADADCLLRELGPTLDVVDDLRSELDEVGSFPTDDGERVLTRGELDLGIAAALYSKETWPFLAQGLYLASTEQDGTLLQVLGDSLVGRRPDGTYDNSQVANGFINCADDPSRPSAAEQFELADAAGDASEHFGPFVRADTGCLGIDPAIDPIRLGPANGAPPILVIGNTGDPATPFDWSVALAESLESGVLYRVEAEGHTAYPTIECVNDVVNAYLVDLEVPEEGAGCSDNSSADFFVPAGTSEFDLVIELLDCLRDEGVDIPEITVADLLADPSGEILLDVLDFGSPEVGAALLACSDIVLELEGS